MIIPLHVKRRIYLNFVLIPKAFASKRFREQVKLKHKHFPSAPFRFKVLRIRSWGTEVSITVTSKFFVGFDKIAWSPPHPEIEAIARGGAALEKGKQGLLKLTRWTEDAVEERYRKSAELLKQDAREMFSEVSINDDGSLFIHDGYHRAGVAFEQGLGGANVIVSIPVDLK